MQQDNKIIIKTFRVSKQLNDKINQQLYINDINFSEYMEYLIEREFIELTMMEGFKNDKL